MTISGLSFTEMLSESFKPFCNLFTTHGWCITYRMRPSSGSLDNILNEFVKAVMKVGGTNVAPYSEQLSFLGVHINPDNIQKLL